MEQFSLKDVMPAIRRAWLTIVIVTTAAAVISAVCYKLSPKVYESSADIVVRNPLYSDRNYLYNNDTKFLDYFGSEEDARRVILFSNSALVQRQVIHNTGMAKAYGLDTTKVKQRLKLEKKFAKNLSAWRTEYGDVMVSFRDKSPLRAAKVANESVRILESSFQEFYTDIRKRMHASIIAKIKEEDSLINQLTDSLVTLREKYGIYDIVNPARHNMMVGHITPGRNKDFGRGLELVQNVESLKDELVADRAVKTTLAHQYTTSYGTSQMPIIKVITPATLATRPIGPGGLATVLIAAVSAFFLTTLSVVLLAGLRKN